MHYSISDFVSTYSQRVRLIAGSGGLARPIDDVGILDYELLPGLRNRYPRVNFHERQLILSSFLYAQHDAHLIGDAIRTLASQGVSGLVIKNVFHLEIPDSALRYANARNFPVMLVTSDDVFFDEVILEVGGAIRNLASASFLQRELDALMSEGMGPADVRERLHTLNPSMREEFVVMHAPIDGGLDPKGFADYERRWDASALASYTNVLLPFGVGLLALVSCDTEQTLDTRGVAQAFASEVLLGGKTSQDLTLGVSELHFSLDEGREAIDEAVQAAHFAARQGGGLRRYGDLGILRALLPCCNQPSLVAHAERLLGPLRDFDAEHEGHLEQTLDCYLVSERSIAVTARALDTHQNTVRYRLDRIEQLTGLSYKIASEVDQLALAMYVEQCRSIAGRRHLG